MKECNTQSVRLLAKKAIEAGRGTILHFRTITILVLMTAFTSLADEVTKIQDITTQFLGHIFRIDPNDERIVAFLKEHLPVKTTWNPAGVTLGQNVVDKQAINGVAILYTAPPSSAPGRLFSLFLELATGFARQYNLVLDDLAINRLNTSGSNIITMFVKENCEVIAECTITNPIATFVPYRIAQGATVKDAWSIDEETINGADIRRQIIDSSGGRGPGTVLIAHTKVADPTKQELAGVR